MSERGGWPTGDALRLGRTRRVHFVGIGGIGMSGIAELLANLGYDVRGTDLARSASTDRLHSLGVQVAIGHAARHVQDAEVVVVSSAIARDNPEVVEARSRHIPVIPRAEMLAELMRSRFGIAVAGAHGKTTTTSMVAWVLEQAGLDPTAVIGGRLEAFGSNARLGRGPFMVVEADESDRSFLSLSPTIAVVTNIDREHLEAYEGFGHLRATFGDFANRVPFYGAVIANVDDPVVGALIPELTRRVVTYGFGHGAAVRGHGPTSGATGGQCEVSWPGDDRVEAGRTTLSLRMPGRHNLENALAAVAVAIELGVPPATAIGALARFVAPERRYEVRGTVRDVELIDDYGHHPTEIAAVLRAARAGDPVRLLAVFQPHRYSRTRDLLDDFGPALGLADVVILTDIYPAGEAPLPGITLDRLVQAVRPAVRDLHVVADLADLPRAVARLARAGDRVVTLGAGSIGRVGDAILEALGTVEVHP